MYHVFQLTALLVRGPATRGERFAISLNWVANPDQEEHGVLICVQDCVRSPHFTQRRLFSESRLRILSESVAIADCITSSSVYAQWSHVETACAGQVVSDLRACWDRAILRTADDMSDRWNHGGNPRSETSSRPVAQISEVAEEGRVAYVPVASPALGQSGPSKILCSRSKRKRKISRSPAKGRPRFPDEFSIETICGISLSAFVLFCLHLWISFSIVCIWIGCIKYLVR